MFPVGRLIPLEHGRFQAVVRGTVVKVTPAKPATGLFKWFRQGAPAVVRVKIDDVPHRELQKRVTHLNDSSGVTQEFGIGWDIPEPTPSTNDRVLVTFGYAGPLDIFLYAAPPVSYKGLKVIDNEWPTDPDEVGTTNEPFLPLKVA